MSEVNVLCVELRTAPQNWTWNKPLNCSRNEQTKSYGEMKRWLVNMKLCCIHGLITDLEHGRVWSYIDFSEDIHDLKKKATLYNRTSLM